MKPERFQELAAGYPRLRIAVAGDYSLDRYLEIDPAREEISIETQLAVHNVVNVRSQPGAAGTILNNLAALGIGRIYPVGFAGMDGEGWELRRALESKAGVETRCFFDAPDRRTFTYTKPLVVEPGKPPVELNRLDFKNWSPTPPELSGRVEKALLELAPELDALIVMDQVDVPGTGVVTEPFLKAIASIATSYPGLAIFADSRRGLQHFPPVIFKMNAAELARFQPCDPGDTETLKRHALELSRRNQQPVFVTLAEQGILGAGPDGEIFHRPALPPRGPIDIVGAGDAVTANLTAALAAGADLPESLEIAMAAASVVLHQLGSTGTAGPVEIAQTLGKSRMTRESRITNHE